MRSTTPPGWPVLAVCAVLIYVPTLLVGALGKVVDAVRLVDDNLAEMGD